MVTTKEGGIPLFKFQFQPNISVALQFVWSSVLITLHLAAPGTLYIMIAVFCTVHGLFCLKPVLPEGNFLNSLERLSKMNLSVEVTVYNLSCSLSKCDPLCNKVQSADFISQQLKCFHWTKVYCIYSLLQ